MKTIDYWKAAKKALGGCSDYALAKRLEITRASASLLSNGHSVMSNTTAAKIAEILELEPMKVIADMELERGTNDELWKRIARKVAAIGGVGAGLVAAHLASSSGADPAQLLEASALFASSGVWPVYYVKSNAQHSAAINRSRLRA